jgi:hypothetical protein
VKVGAIVPNEQTCYLVRRRVEDTISFIRQSYQLKDIPLLNYECLRNMAALVMAAAYFAWVYLGKCVRFQILSDGPHGSDPSVPRVGRQDPAAFLIL